MVNKTNQRPLMRNAFYWIAVSYAVSAASWLAAQDPKAAPDPTATTWTKQKIEAPPARELEFDVRKDAERRKLFRVDAKLLAQKYVARVRLKLPDRRRSDPFRDKGLTDLVQFGDRSVVNTFIQMRENRVPSKSLQSFLERVPEDRRAKLEELDFFKSEDVDQGYLVLATQRPADFISEFHILAHTQEEAERRAASLIALIDWGVTRPIQLKLLERYTSQSESLKKLDDALLAAEADLARLQKESQTFVGVTGEMLPGLKLQQIQLEADLAGVKARLAACDARLKAAEVKPEIRAQLEALKLSAEIELAGCEARHGTAVKLVERVMSRNRVNQDLITAQTLVNNSKAAAFSARNSLEDLKHALDDYQPFPLVDDAVIIQPVEWTQ